MKNRVTFFSLCAIVAIALTIAIGAHPHIVRAAGDPSAPVQLYNPLANTVDPDAPVQSLAAIFINAIFGIAGSIALAMFVWGGILWLTSAGNEKQVTKGRGVLQWTVLGMIMMFASYTLVNYLFTNLGTGATGSSATGSAGGGAAGAGTGGGAAPGSVTGVTSLCCVNDVTGVPQSVQDQNSCTGANSHIFNGACEDLKFCGPSAGQSGKCTPIPKSGSCDSGSSLYNTLQECNINNSSTGAPPSTANTSPYCCMTKNKKKFDKVDATSDDDAGTKCKKSGFDYYYPGECTTSLLNSLK